MTADLQIAVVARDIPQWPLRPSCVNCKRSIDTAIVNGGVNRAFTNNSACVQNAAMSIVRRYADLSLPRAVTESSAMEAEQ